MITELIESRSASGVIEAQDSSDGMVTLRGLAVATNKPYKMGSKLGGTYQEQIKSGAFRDTLATGADVSLLIEHKGLPLARTTNQTMKLWESNRGLEVEARVDASDPDVVNLLPKMRKGLVNEMSFTFRCNDRDQVWAHSPAGLTRTISKLDMDRLDVSIVRAGANPGTELNLRSIMEAIQQPELQPQVIDPQAPVPQVQVQTQPPAQPPVQEVTQPQIPKTEESAQTITKGDTVIKNSETNSDEDEVQDDLDLRMKLYEKAGASLAK